MNEPKPMLPEIQNRKGFRAQASKNRKEMKAELKKQREKKAKKRR